MPIHFCHVVVCLNRVFQFKATVNVMEQLHQNNSFKKPTLNLEIGSVTIDLLGF